MNTDAALILLGLAAMPTDEVALQRAYREAAKAAHPDGGGTAETFRAVLAAKVVVKKAMEKTTQPMGHCSMCRGAGVVKGRIGMVACDQCAGSGATY